MPSYITCLICVGNSKKKLKLNKLNNEGDSSLDHLKECILENSIFKDLNLSRVEFQTYDEDFGQDVDLDSDCIIRDKMIIKVVENVDVRSENPKKKLCLDSSESRNTDVEELSDEEQQECCVVSNEKKIIEAEKLSRSKFAIEYKLPEIPKYFIDKEKYDSSNEEERKNMDRGIVNVLYHSLIDVYSVYIPSYLIVGEKLVREYPHLGEGKKWQSLLKNKFKNFRRKLKDIPDVEEKRKKYAGKLNGKSKNRKDTADKGVTTAAIVTATVRETSLTVSSLTELTKRPLSFIHMNERELDIEDMNLGSDISPRVCPSFGVTASPASGVTASPTSDVTASPTSDVTASPTSGVTASPDKALNSSVQFFEDERSIKAHKKRMIEELKKTAPDFRIINSKMDKTFAERFAEIKEGKNLEVILEHYPALQDNNQLLLEFHRITKVDIEKKLKTSLTDLTDKIWNNSPPIAKGLKTSLVSEVNEEIDESRKKQKKLIGSFLLLPSFVKEHHNRVFFNQNSTETQIPTEPVIVFRGKEIISAKKFYIHIDSERFLETNNFITAICIWFSSYWVFNIAYANKIAKCLALIETELLGMNNSNRSQSLLTAISTLHGTQCKVNLRKKCKM